MGSLPVLNYICALNITYHFYYWGMYKSGLIIGGGWNKSIRNQAK